nr:putative uncharacterized protein C10orf128 homolog isoform X4 [Microcebus murinus]
MGQPWCSCFQPQGTSVGWLSDLETSSRHLLCVGGVPCPSRAMETLSFPLDCHLCQGRDPVWLGHRPHLLNVGGAQVLATGKSAGAEIDIKYALIGTALGVAISAGFLALKICMIRRRLFDDYSSDLRSAHQAPSDATLLKKRAPRLNLHFSESRRCVVPGRLLAMLLT